MFIFFTLLLLKNDGLLPFSLLAAYIRWALYIGSTLYILARSSEASAAHARFSNYYRLTAFYEDIIDIECAPPWNTLHAMKLLPAHNTVRAITENCIVSSYDRFHIYALLFISRILTGRLLYRFFRCRLLSFSYLRPLFRYIAALWFDIFIDSLEVTANSQE